VASIVEKPASAYTKIGVQLYLHDA
jgi:hypothetical protein